MRLLFIFNIISLFYFLEGSTPINFTFGVGGYGGYVWGLWNANS